MAERNIRTKTIIYVLNLRPPIMTSIQRPNAIKLLNTDKAETFALCWSQNLHPTRLIGISPTSKPKPSNQ